MITLSPHECRVLSVMIEKALTVQSQYPITLNGLITGCNQKSNRNPVMTLSEEQVLCALDSLRTKQLAREVMMSGSRVTKYKHNAREGLDIDTRELVVMAELLMRGPQTVGELRTRASRMHALDSTDVVQNIVNNLMAREPAMARKLAPGPGSRAPRYAQLLCPDLHPLDAPAEVGSSSTPAASAQAADSGLADRVSTLEREVAQLKVLLESLTSPS
ncbi:MAG: YceH family protein [Planctomycetota bacterium]